jgi:hypothetical protein
MRCDELNSVPVGKKSVQQKSVSLPRSRPFPNSSGYMNVDARHACGIDLPTMLLVAYDLSLRANLSTLDCC